MKKLILVIDEETLNFEKLDTLIMPIYDFFSQKWPTMGVVPAGMNLLLLNIIDKTLHHFAKIALKFLQSKILHLILS